MDKNFRTFRLRFKFFFVIIIGFILAPELLFAWGQRGHSLECEAAIHLVKDKNLKLYLMSKLQGITYLCNLPDTYWRRIDGAESGGPTHFFEPDVVGLSFETIPNDYSEFVKLASGKINLAKNKLVQSVPRELGSSWWRANQFSQLAIEAGLRANKNKNPINEDEDLYQMWVMMGILGHFVTDNAQPFHNTRDFDGWDKGHGGIHSFYESDLVNEFSYEILSNIINGSTKVAKDLNLKKNHSFIDGMRQLSILSRADLPILYQLDSVLKESKIISEKGMEIKNEDERLPARNVLNKFKPILITHLSRGATLLASFWDQIYEAAGRPNLAKDKSFKFPHQFNFIYPKYIDEL